MPKSTRFGQTYFDRLGQIWAYFDKIKEARVGGLSRRQSPKLTLVAGFWLTGGARICQIWADVNRFGQIAAAAVCGFCAERYNVFK